MVKDICLPPGLVKFPSWACKTMAASGRNSGSSRVPVAKRLSLYSLAVIALLTSVQSACCQVSVDVRKCLVGVTSPEVIGERLFVGPDSNPSVSDVAVVTVDTAWKYRLLKFRRNGVRIQAETLTESQFLVVGKGKYELAATLFDPDKGIYDEEFSFELGGVAPNPPGPDPPNPPPPNVVPNEYNVGAIAYQTAPIDQANAMKLAGVYRAAANYLYGNPRLMDVQAAGNWIRQQFDAKQCIDQATCQQWTVWFNQVNSSLAAEQRKRGMFTRADWFAAWSEVATALEARAK